MSRIGSVSWVGVIALALALGACRVEEEAGERASSMAEGEVSEATGEPEAVAPAAGVEEGAMKRWMVIEFARAVEDADLRWLEDNGFRVDTLMSEILVRGWLEDLEGGPVIDQDPRVAKIHAQMR